MSDGSLSVKLAPDYEMDAVQKQLEDYGTGEDIIRNDDFFPDISLSAFRNQYRADGTITSQRLQDALIEGMASVNEELSTFKTQSKRDSLEQITAPSINGESVLIYRYKRAVSCLALANLYERYASYDSTNDGEKKMAQLKDSIDELRRDARFAISDILGRKRVDAELI
jgi:Phage head completion protein (GPL).|nr:MAG TPA: head completion protein [Caudoviricetes sp.]